MPDDWPERRAFVLARDGWRCRSTEDGPRCKAQATDVDHIEAGNDHSHENLQALCSWHHDRKSSREGNAARWAVRRQRPAERHPGLI